ncbi:MAG: hypothetical protein AAF790_09825 [Planctomycetota bacterium]
MTLRRRTPAIAAACLIAAWLCGLAAAQPPDRSSDRMERAMRAWDKNGDGVLTKDEAPGRAWRFVERRAEAAGIQPGEGVKIADLTQRSGDGAGQSDSDRRGTRGGDEPRSGDHPDKAKGFDRLEQPQPAQGFGTPADAPGRSEKAAEPRGKQDEAEYRREQARRYARGLLSRYDRNNNRILEQSEWRRIRGEPEKADFNGDGKITLDELTARVEARNREREQAAAAERGGGRRDGRSRDSSRRGRDDRRRDSGSDAAAGGAGRKSYRFTPAQERLPEGLPGWFVDRDTNGDGQVAMHEYSRSWSDRKAEEFARYDANGDGMVTPEEVIDRR